MDKLFLTFTTQQKLNYKPRHRVRELQKIMRSTKIGCEQRKVTSGTTITTDYVEGRAYRKQPVAVFSEGASWRWGIYVSNHLQLFNPLEGYVEPINASNYALLFRHTFQYKDHLGNIRLSYKDLNQNTGAISLSIVEEHNYYPFGLKHNGYNGGSNGQRRHKYMFGGKELQDEIVGSNSFEVYDFGARNYDQALGRWMNLDPLAEQMRRHSPYNYAFNNPIYFIDPDGMAPRDIFEIYRNGDIKKIEQKGEHQVVIMDEEGNRSNIVVNIGENADLVKRSSATLDYNILMINDSGKAKDAFKAIAKNTNVEHANITYEDIDGNTKAAIVNNGGIGEVNGTGIGKDVFDKDGNTVKEIVHNHPQNTIPSGYDRETGEIEMPLHRDAVGAGTPEYARNNKGEPIVRGVYKASFDKINYYDDKKVHPEQEY